jgi:cytochrome c553
MEPLAQTAKMEENPMSDTAYAEKLLNGTNTVTLPRTDARIEVYYGVESKSVSLVSYHGRYEREDSWDSRYASPTLDDFLEQVENQYSAKVPAVLRTQVMDFLSVKDSAFSEQVELGEFTSCDSCGDMNGDSITVTYIPEIPGKSAAYLHLTNTNGCFEPFTLDGAVADVKDAVIGYIASCVRDAERAAEYAPMSSYTSSSSDYYDYDDHDRSYMSDSFPGESAATALLDAIKAL